LFLGILQAVIRNLLWFPILKNPGSGLSPLRGFNDFAFEADLQKSVPLTAHRMWTSLLKKRINFSNILKLIPKYL
jgi:hypothetical protein